MEQVKMGALYLDGVAQSNPQNPVWNGDIPRYDGNAEILIADAPEDNTDIQITWNVVTGMEKWSRSGTLLIADRVLLTSVSWDDLASAGFAEGVTIHLKGRPYLCHLLPVGVEDGAPNAWDDALNRTTEDDEIWHWRDVSFWGAEEVSTLRVYRGNLSARCWISNDSSRRNAFLGFRPALEPLESDEQESNCEEAYAQVERYIQKFSAVWSEKQRAELIQKILSPALEK